MAFFVHYTDPGFPEHPWPNERRLGPYPTADEALAQAVEDAAGGYAVAVGVYDEAESEKRMHSTARSVGKATHTSSVVRRKGETRARAILEEGRKTRQADVDAFAAILPPGLGVEEALEILRASQERYRSAQSFTVPEPPDPTAEPT